MFGVAEEEGCKCSLKDIAWKHTAYHINNSDLGHTRLKQ